ncbi:MAG: PIG-L family deacetylase, partial [Alphaproteobacteria bacterium]
MQSALAIFAHPDDIEFVAAGTLLQLKQRGWETHYL